MIFMGEEFGSDQPFPFFCDFETELATKVRDGRRAEFAKFPEFHDPASRERIPDPTLEQTFLSAKLDWLSATEGAHANWTELYRELLDVRQREIIPRLKGAQPGTFQLIGNGAVSARWTLGDGSQLYLTANLSATPLRASVVTSGRQIWGAGVAGNFHFPPWGVFWSIEGVSGEY
jgi:maltooligosyltrehalose trehalohydrolase